MKKIFLILAGVIASAGCVAGVLLLGANKTAEPSSEAVVASTEKTESRSSDNAPIQIGNSEVDSEDAEEVTDEEPATEATETETPNTLNIVEDKNDEAESSQEAVVSNEEAKTEPQPEKEAQPAATAEKSKDLEAEKKSEEEVRRDEEEYQRQLAEMATRHNASLIIPWDRDKGGYPYAKRCPYQKDAFVDQWGMYICECVSYAAWKVYQTYGYMPNWGGSGNANQWLANAREAGYSVSSTPKVGTVGISNAGPLSNAVWVEEVDGDRVHVSQYNARNMATHWRSGEYSEQWIDSSAYTYIDFGSR